MYNSTFLFLATEAVFTIIGGACGIVVGILLVLLFSKVLRAKKISTTERLVAEMKANAENECKAIKKEAIVEVKEQELRLRTEFEKESREKRAELQKMEQRLNLKDETLNKKDANLLKRTEEVESLAKSLEQF